jgi:hypothetical protein
VVIKICVKYPGGPTRMRVTDIAATGQHVQTINYKFVTVPLPKRLRNGRFTSETAVRRFQKRNRHLDPEVVKKSVGASINS